MATLGYFIAEESTLNVPSVKQNTLSAATVYHPNVTAQSLFPQKTEERTITDTIYVTNVDTVTVTNTKYVRVPVLKHTTDTIYASFANLPEVTVTSVKNKSPGDTESSLDVTLTIDGKTVYSSKTDSIVFDEP